MRIGILGNNQDDCATVDSRIGFGMQGLPDYSITCGVAANAYLIMETNSSTHLDTSWFSRKGL